MSTPLKLAEETTRRSVDRRWIALSFIALAQLMIALDATIVSIALPWAQRALGASDAQRQWVITAYTLAFAGLLLVGGRIADTFGVKELIEGLHRIPSLKRWTGMEDAFHYYVRLKRPTS